MNRNYNLFLDDVRMPEQCTFYNVVYMPVNKRMYTMEQWEIVRNFDEFVRVITQKLSEGSFPEKISFDHDLADIHYDPSTWTESFVYREKTGDDCTKWLVQQCILENLKLPECWIHSQNTIGAERIWNSLRDYDRYVKFKEKIEK